jgi:periplasmic protein TonB
MHAPGSFASGSGSKFGKIAIVVALHAAFGVALIGMKIVQPATKSAPPIDLLPPIPAPQTPVEPLPNDALKPETKMPTIVIPIIDPLIIKTAEPDPIVAKPSENPQVERTKPSGNGGESTKSEGNGEAKKETRVFSAALANAKDCALPDYPKSAARNGDTGTVSLALLIDTDGRVKNHRIQQSSGFRELDRAAIAALSMCKFKPATTNGVAEPAWGQIAYVWRLD